MTRVAARLLPPAVALLLASLLGTGALDAWPALLRLALALGVLVLSPGFAWLRALGVRPPGGAPCSAGWALGLGVAWLGLGVLVATLLGVPFLVLARAGAPWSALPWLVAAWRAPSESPARPGVGRLAALAVAAAAVLAAVHVARHPTPLTWHSDSPDHIGTIRRMLESGDAFPRDAFFMDAGPAGADPRKGVWHPCVALVCALSSVDPVVAWRGLAVLLAPLFVLNAAAFAFLLGGGLAAAVGAWGLLLTYGGGLASQYLAEAVFATKLADQLALATVTAVLVDVERGEVRTRLVAVGLVLGTVLTHVFGAIQFGVTFAALGVGLLVRERGSSRSLGRLVVTSLTCAAVVAPYLGWRALQSYAPVNVIHTETQGMLELARGLTVVGPGAVWDWLGPAWVLIPLSLWAWARAARSLAALLLLTTTLAVALLMFCPPLVAVLEPRVGYLLMRLPWLLWPSAAAAFLVVRARDAWRERHRGVTLAAAAALALGLSAPLADAVHAFTRAAPDPDGPGTASLLRWRGAYAWMDRELPAGTVVLSDPATCYGVPMLTRHWVTTLVDQHSSPNDSLALERILDARDALDPYADWGRTADVVRRWGASAIVLNRLAESAPGLDYWSASPAWYAAARVRLDSAPEAFERVHDDDGFTVYRVHESALEALGGDARPRPFVRRATADDRARSLGAGLPGLVSFRLGDPEAARGDTLEGRIEWRVVAPLPPGSYRVGVRFDRALPADVPAAPRAISKAWRKLVERVRHERYRFRADHLPAAGAYGVDRWVPSEVVADSFRLVVPTDVAPGDYAVKVSIRHEPHYPNLRLRDLLSDDDYLDGPVVGRLQVRGAGGR